MLAAVTETWETYNLTLRTLQHLGMFTLSFLIALVLGTALGILFFSSARFRTAGFPVLTIVEMIPDIALLILLIPLIGIGLPPTVCAAVLYSLLPVAANTTAGLLGVRPELVDNALALGLTPREILYHIRIPLSLPLMAVGVRIAVIFCMGVVTLGGIVGAGGLGAPLQTGITTGNDLLIIVTGCWVTVLAVSLDGITAGLVRNLSRRYGGGT